MKKKLFKLLPIFTVAILLLSYTLGLDNHSTYAATQKNYLYSIPMDENIIPMERLAESLKKQGRINNSASKEAELQAVENYIKKKKMDTEKDLVSRDEITQEASNFMKRVKESNIELKEKSAQVANSNASNQKAETRSLNGKLPVPPAKSKEYHGDIRTDKVLVLLVEFDDFKHNNIEQVPGYMYSNDFNQQHYQNMLFGDEQFTLSNGTKINTFKQYYEEQSGGSYTVDGTVTNWITVPGKASDYGADANEGRDNKGPLKPRDLVKDALKSAVASGLDLSEFDKYDQYDVNENGKLNEPDGIIDHLMIIHAGEGQESGGGKLGDNAIWSHRSKVALEPFAIEETKSSVPYWNNKIAVYDYTMEPEDGAVGIFAHEFGHDLGLPDEYDTKYSGQGEPIESWSIMSDGSWAGEIAGTTPTSFSPQNKEFFQNTMGGNWANIIEVDYAQLNKGIGYATFLDQSVTKSDRPGIIRVNLPDKQVRDGIQPEFGKKYYFSTRGDDIHTTLETPTFDLTNATSAKFDFKSFFEIESNSDIVEITAVEENGNKTILERIGENETQDKFTSTNYEWIDKSYDLSSFKGKKIKLMIEYITDGSLTSMGFAIDNASLSINGDVVFLDDAESEPKFKLNGFIMANGIEDKKHNYYLEWRNYAGSDKGLRFAHAIYNTGLVVWYADSSYTDNWVGIHPGRGFLGVVDSHPEPIVGELNGKPTVANSTKYQISDAAFSLNPTPRWIIGTPMFGTFDYASLPGVSKFDDSNKYINNQIPDAGRELPNFGLKFEVVGQSSDNSAGAIRVYR